MYTISDLKHNKFKNVEVPSTMELYRKFGLTEVASGAKYSGDDFIDPAASKTDVLRDMMKD